LHTTEQLLNHYDPIFEKGLLAGETSQQGMFTPPKHLIPPPAFPGVRVSPFVYLTCSSHLDFETDYSSVSRPFQLSGNIVLDRPERYELNRVKVLYLLRMETCRRFCIYFLILSLIVSKNEQKKFYKHLSTKLISLLIQGIFQIALISGHLKRNETKRNENKIKTKRNETSNQIK
jgi:hypothetical protein